MATPAKSTKWKIDRRLAVENAVASFRMEGLEPDAKTRALLESFSRGDLSIEEFGSAVERHVEKLKSASAERKAS